MSSAANPLSDATVYVRDAVEAWRARGMKVAVAEVARLLGFSERRVRAFMYGEVRQLLANEWLALQQRQRTEMQARLSRMDAEAALLRACLARCDDQ